MTKATKKQVKPPVTRTSEGQRDLLFDAIDDMRNGEMSASDGNTVARLSAEISKTVEIELELQKFIHKNPKMVDVSLPPSVRLGS